MDRAAPADCSFMDLSSIGPSLPASLTRTPSTRDADQGSFAALLAPADPHDTLPLPSATGDPAENRQKMLHLISHVNAECFISLLKIVDPRPDDYRARAVYDRRYRELRHVLEIPILAGDSAQDAPTDPLK